MRWTCQKLAEVATQTSGFEVGMGDGLLIRNGDREVLMKGDLIVRPDIFPPQLRGKMTPAMAAKYLGLEAPKEQEVSH